MRYVQLAAFCLGAAVYACGNPYNSSRGGPGVDTGGRAAAPTAYPAHDLQPRSADSAHLAHLEAQAKALVKTVGCSSDSQCRNAAVGIKACGGPRYYISYCAASTDTTALFAKLSELARAERAYNKKYNIVSTCEMIMPPRPHLEGGSCR